MKRCKRFLSLLLATLVILTSMGLATLVSASATGTLCSYFSTNPNGQVGKNTAISIDGSLSDWDSSMLIAQGTANDDPRVYRPNSMYEVGVDLYALYGAYDDSNIYLMWEMTNVQDVVAPSDNYPLSQGTLWQTQEFPFFIMVDTGKADSAIGNNGALTTGGTIWNSGMTVQNSFNNLIAINTKGGNGPWVYGGDSSGLNPKEILTSSTSGVKMKFGKGILSKNVYGIDQAYGAYNNRVPGDVCDESAAWVDFNTKGHDSASMDFFYEMSIPFSEVGITKADVETNGIGVMLVATMGMSPMDCLPGDVCMTDQADLDDAANSQENNSFEKSDEDFITAPFARIGKLGSGGIITPPTPETTAAPTTQAPTTAAPTTQAPTTAAPATTEAKPVVTDAPEVTTIAPPIATPIATTVAPTTAAPKPSIPVIPMPTTDPQETIATQAPTTVAPKPTVPVIPMPTTDPDEIVNPTNIVVTPAEYVILGDADLSNKVNVKDATLIQKHIANLEILSDKAVFAAEVDGNGKVNIKDATNIQKWVAKYEVEYKIGEEVVYKEAVTAPAPTTAAPATTEAKPVVTDAPEVTTTAAPVVTTVAPTTVAPVVTTVAPTTVAPVVTTAVPTTVAPTTAAPVYTDPVYTEPVYTDPVYTEPVYTDPIYTDPIPGGTITVYFQNNYGWGSVYWHAWNEAGGTSTPWPGDLMENVGGNVYKATVDASFTSIIFNDGSNNDANKTSDTIIPSDGQIFDGSSWNTYDPNNNNNGGDNGGNNGGDNGGDYGDGRVVYFSNNKFWSTVNAYCFSSAGGENSAWPGVAMEFVKTNDFGEDIYSYTVPGNMTHIIFTDGGSQSVDIELSSVSDNGFYLTDQNGEGKFEFGTYSFS